MKTRGPLNKIRRFLSNAESILSIIYAIGSIIGLLTSLVISVYAYIKGATWLISIILFLLILILFLIITWLLVKILVLTKYKKQRELDDKYESPWKDEGKGFLDFIVDGEEAVKDLNLSITRVEKYIRKIGTKIRWKSRRLSITKSKMKQRMIAKSAADLMNKYSSLMNKECSHIRKISQSIKINYSGYLNQLNDLSKQQIGELQSFIDSFDISRQPIPDVVKSLVSFRENTSALSGVTSDLNIASQKLKTTLSNLIGAIKKYDKICKFLIDLASRKIG